MKSLIAMVVDKSGSMASLATDTIGSFNQFIAEQKKVEGEADFLLTLFSDTVEVGAIIPLQDVPALNEKTYVPSGMTALHDAIGMTIDKVGAMFANGARPAGKVIVCIITDGHENSSREYSKSRIHDMVKTQTDTYQWTFLFLGANIDAFDVGGNLGVLRQHTQSYAATPDGIRGAYSSTSGIVKGLRGN